MLTLKLWICNKNLVFLWFTDMKTLWDDIAQVLTMRRTQTFWITAFLFNHNYKPCYNRLYNTNYYRHLFSISTPCKLFVCKGFSNGRWGIRTRDPLIKSQLHKNTKSSKSKDLQQAESVAYKPAYKDNPKTAENQAQKLSTELLSIVKVWPSLPEHIKQAIKTLTQTHIKEQK